MMRTDGLISQHSPIVRVLRLMIEAVEAADYKVHLKLEKSRG